MKKELWVIHHGESLVQHTYETIEVAGSFSRRLSSFSHSFLKLPHTKFSLYRTFSEHFRTISKRCAKTKNINELQSGICCNDIGYSPNVMLYCALKPCLVMEKSVVNLILSNVVLSPLTVTVNPDLDPLSLSILWPKMSVNSTKSQLQE